MSTSTKTSSLQQGDGGCGKVAASGASAGGGSVGEACAAMLRNATASTMGASIVALLVTPLDVAKVRMQAHVCPAGPSVTCTHPDHPRGTMHMMRRIVRTDGLRGLWRGLGPTMVLAVPTTGFYFTLYEAMRTNGGLSPLYAGAAARTVAATVASPLELARTQLQSGRGSLSGAGVFDVLNRVRTQSGTLALWRGLVPTLLRDVPFSAIYWYIYESLRDPAGSRPLDPLTGGVVAGSVAAFCTTPADVIKTRRQTASPVADAKGPPSIRQIVRRIARNDGFAGFFRGVVPRLAKIAPSSGVMMFSYAAILQFLTPTN